VGHTPARLTVAQERDLRSGGREVRDCEFRGIEGGNRKQRLGDLHNRAAFKYLNLASTLWKIN
jgi:hypothetical protein